jgi:hypothetical protein
MHSAMQAAERILSFSDTIPAMDQQAFVAGFVELLSIYPQPVIERAMSPSRGLPAMVSYPNLAKYREHLEVWAREHAIDRPDRSARTGSVCRAAAQILKPRPALRRGFAN